MWWEPADLQGSGRASLWVGRDWEAVSAASGSRGTGGAWEAEADFQQERPAHIQLEVEAGCVCVWGDFSLTFIFIPV